MAGPVVHAVLLQQNVHKKVSLFPTVFQHYVAICIYELCRYVPLYWLTILFTMVDKRTWDCVKNTFLVIVTQDSAPNDNFFYQFQVYPPTPLPPQCCGQKALIFTHFAQTSTLFGVGGDGSLGGEGSLVLLISVFSFTNLNTAANF